MARSEKRLHWLMLLSGRWGAQVVHIRILRVYLRRFHGWLVHVSRGAFPGSRNHMILRTTGRRTGKIRQVPLIYIEDGDGYVVVASSGGFDLTPKWWLNLQANPEVTIEIRGKATRVRAEEVSSEERERLWPNLLEVWPLYDNYVARTERHIPVVLLTPSDS
jgi:deazaflavin-dependent oxidoreductase (nitroreductase family)